MLRKCGLPSSWPTCQSHLGLPNSSTTSPSCLPQQRTRPCRTSQCKRTNAQLHSRQHPEFRDNMNWPAKLSASTTLTPYSIFDLDRGATYSKRRFYELVKIYHPDRQSLGQSLGQSPPSEKISHSERLERYRLIILAHQILSDPVKRRAYDDHGTGWVNCGHIMDRYTQGYHAQGSRKPYGRGPGHDDSPFGNATWEDWERWYARDNTEKSKQNYVGNFIDPNIFASIVIVTAVISGAAQATSGGPHSGSLEERAQAFTAKTSRFLENRAEAQKNDTSNSEDRVKWFLSKRDPSKYGLKDDEQHIYEGHFSPQVPPDRKHSDCSDTPD